MLPKEYFDDPLTEGVAFEHVLDNRFTLLKLPVGYGKTVIAMQVAKLIRSQTTQSDPKRSLERRTFWCHMPKGSTIASYQRANGTRFLRRFS